ncbi:MAG: DUF1015 family protein [Bacteroidia bacterium]
MPKIYPFKALRPREELVSAVSAKSTDFPVKEDLIEELRTNENTFHHVTKSHLSYAGAFQEPEKFLPFAAQYIKKMKQKGVLIKEEKPSFYIYEQIRKDGKKFVGIIGLCSIDDHKENHIKKHEEIRPSRLKYLVELFKTTKIMGEPTLLAHKGTIELEDVETEVIFDFESVDKKRHIIKRVDEKDSVKIISDQMTAIENFYIADGHHRSASTEQFNEKVNSLSNDRSMCYIIPEDQLEILPFHRLIKGVVPIAPARLLSLLSEKFSVSLSETPLYTIREKQTFGLYIDKQWYKLEYTKPTELLDVEIIEEYVVKEIFSIADSRTDSQISFLPYTAGLDRLLDLVDSRTYNVAITSKECTFQEVRKVSDQERTLPAKSTYIEPKLRSGMIIQEFEVIK